jgi:type II secretory pathway predicted ATPase ExeA
MTQNQLLRHFGLTGLGLYQGEMHRTLIRELTSVVNERGNAAVVGEFGSGKTELLDMVAQATPHSVRWVYVNTPDKEGLRITSVMNAMARELLGSSSETPRRSSEALATQLQRLLGEAVKGRGESVVLVIENAHRLHPNVLMALKDMREMRYAGIRPLFATILVGQEPLASRLETYGEVWYRTQVIELNERTGWMTVQERVAYLASRFGRAIEPATRQRIAALVQRPLVLDHFVLERMADAMAAGYDVVDERVMTLSLAEQKAALGASNKQIAQAAHRAGAGRIGDSTVSEVINGANVSEESRAKVQAGLRQIELETAQMNGRRAANA